MEAVGGMSDGKRNHEGLSDIVALVEAARKGYQGACNHRPTVRSHLDGQPVRSAIE